MAAASTAAAFCCGRAPVESRLAREKVAVGGCNAWLRMLKLTYPKEHSRVTESEAIVIIIEHLEQLFPKTCPRCDRRYESLREFYIHTRPEGVPVFRDLDAGRLYPEKPLGAMATSTCPCGESIPLTSDGMPIFRYWSLLLWAQTELLRRHLKAEELLQHLRVEVRQRVIAKRSP